MPKNVFTMFFTCHNEFQGPLRWLCEICDCTCHVYIIDIVCRWNRHSYNPKEVPTWMEDFCSDQICKERCKNSIRVAILPLLPLCSVNISLVASCKNPLQSPSFPPCLRLELWQPLTLKVRNIRNTSKIEHWEAGLEPPLGSDPRRGLQMPCLDLS